MPEASQIAGPSKAQSILSRLIGFPVPVLADALDDEIAALEANARESERFRCANAVCPHCASGTPLDVGLKAHNGLPCAAAPIYATFDVSEMDEDAKKRVAAMCTARAKEPNRAFTDEEKARIVA